MYRLLDVYAGAGGCSMGYFHAGFTPYGIDHDPKPLRHYPFPWACMDALEALEKLIRGEGLTFSNGETLCLRDFAAIHASPPCQYYSRLRHLPWLKSRVYWRSVPPTREALIRTGKPWVIENVKDCWDLLDSIILNGQMFGLPIFRDRRFAASFLLLQPPPEKRNGVITPGRARLSQRHPGAYHLQSRLPVVEVPVLRGMLQLAETLAQECGR